jgi:hypothetical protein
MWCKRRLLAGYGWSMGEFGVAMVFYLQSANESCILTFDVKAGSSIRQSSGLQIRRLQVRFLSRLPTHHHLTTWRDGGVVDRARLENERTNVPRVRIPLSPPVSPS